MTPRAPRMLAWRAAGVRSGGCGFPAASRCSLIGRPLWYSDSMRILKETRQRCQRSERCSRNLSHIKLSLFAQPPAHVSCGFTLVPRRGSTLKRTYLNFCNLSPTNPQSWTKKTRSSGTMTATRRRSRLCSPFASRATTPCALRQIA